MPIPQKRACDACHRRKVRCLGGHPCQNCSQAGLACTFLAIPRKKGPKGSRAKIISELRESQQNLKLSPAAIVPMGYGGLGTPPDSPHWPRGSSLLTNTLARSCIDFFFANMYPTMPILHRAGLYARLAELDTSIESHCLISSLCAFMLIQSGMRLVPDRPDVAGTSDGDYVTGAALLQETLRVRKEYDYVDSPSEAAAMTSFFFFGCYFGLDKHATAWYHLREATTLAQILGMQDESTYLTGDPLATLMRRRLFWILYVTERAYALQRHRPLTLHATIEMPCINEDPNEAREISGFIYLVNLFRPFDDVFVGLWNKTRADCSTAWLAQLQDQVVDALPKKLDCRESQAADLKTSQHWLRTKIWELSISNGYLSSTSSASSMTFQYPIDIARDLADSTNQLSQQSMEIHGLGLIEKLFDIACTLTDVMSCVPIANLSSGASMRLGPSEYLDQCLKLISTLRGGSSRFLPLLLAKINDTVPGFQVPMTKALTPSQVGQPAEEVHNGSSPDTQDSYSPGALPAQFTNLSPMTSSMNDEVPSAGSQAPNGIVPKFESMQIPVTPFTTHWSVGNE